MASLEYKYVQEISVENQLKNNGKPQKTKTTLNSTNPTSLQASVAVPPALNCGECSLPVNKRNCDSLNVIEMSSIEKRNVNHEVEADKQIKPKKGPRPPPPPGLKDDLTTIAHICVLIFVVLIVYLCIVKPFEFFTWHPLLLSIGWMLLMTEGVLFISKENPVVRRLRLGRDLKLRYHWIAIVISLALVALGFLVVIITKNERGKEHFKTWHAIFGLISILGCIPSVINGTVALFDVELKRYIKPALNTAIHVASGTVVVAFGGLSLITSLYTNWFKKHSDNNKYLLMLGLVTTIYTIIWTAQRPLRKTLRKFFKFENV